MAWMPRTMTLFTGGMTVSVPCLAVCSPLNSNVCFGYFGLLVTLGNIWLQTQVYFDAKQYPDCAAGGDGPAGAEHGP